MLITKCEGVGLEKSSPTSPEDSFNRSTVVFEANGRERTFNLIYLKFFETKLDLAMPVKDIAGLCALIQHPEYQERKRLYIHEEETFAALFENLDMSKIQEVKNRLETEGSYELESSIAFMN